MTEAEKEIILNSVCNHSGTFAEKALLIVELVERSKQNKSITELCNAIKEMRQNESAIARKTHYHLKQIEKSLAEINKKNI